MNAGTFATILAVLLVLNLIMDLVYAWLERRAMRVFAEVLELMVPVMEDIRRIEPHLDESVELAMIRTAELLPRAQRMANGYITPIGLIPRRRKQ